MTGQPEVPWYEQPDIAAAIARAREIIAISWLPHPLADAELAARGEHPVTLAYGELDTPALDDLYYGAVGRLAEEHGCRSRGGGHDYTTFLFGTHEAAAGFAAALRALPRPRWWRVSESAAPDWGP